MRISDWSSDVCSSDLEGEGGGVLLQLEIHGSATGGANRHDPVHEGGQQCRAPVRRGAGGDDGQVVLERHAPSLRSEEHTSELQSLMRISYAVFCLKKKSERRTAED